ncbi:MAG: TRAP transporter small permease [Betaproteobacteria bacterium]|nr:TRAP transporter small permease [Betaproteobacteria bacterium]MDH3437028.1 TRAP transporter small permease [Betaproteobacteria bacterium]
MERAYAIWRAFQDRFLAYAAALLLLGCTLLALLEVIRRYVFGVSFEWQQDAVTFFILSGVFLYFGIAQRREAHLTVTLFVELVEKLGPRVRRAAEVLRLIVFTFSLVFLLAVVWWGIPEVLESQHYDTRTESLQFPMAPFLWVLLVGFFFMAVSLFFQIYREIQRLRGRSVLVEPPDEGEIPH